MKELMQKLRESSVKEILDCDSAERLEAMRVRYLGKKGELTAVAYKNGAECGRSSLHTVGAPAGVKVEPESSAFAADLHPGG